MEEKNNLQEWQEAEDGNNNVDQERYIEDIKSWLMFNDRVLFEAARETNPILERLNFLGIADSNMDEFIRTKFRNNKGLKKAIKRQTIKLEEIYDSLLVELERYGIKIVPMSEIKHDRKAYKTLKDKFRKNIFPILQPLILKNELPLPDIQDGGNFIITKLDNEDARGVTCILKIPDSKLIKVNMKGTDKTVYVMQDDLILEFINEFYKGKKILWNKPFRVLRRIESLYVDTQSNYITTIKEGLNKRKKAEVVIVDLVSDIDGLRSICGDAKKRKRKYVFGLSFLKDIKDVINYSDEMVYKKTKPRIPLDFIGKDIFKIISDGDIVVHMPYQSFDLSTVRFLEAAAKDPNVKAIKQTLYRVTGDSPITKALIEAAKSGKQVTVLLELKAKFDEYNNIKWAEELSKAGCDIIFGPVEMKTHGKISMVIREENGVLQKYLNISTGNFNDATAKVYEDISIFIKDRKKFKVADDMTQLFNYLGGYCKLVRTKEILLAPYNFRSTIEEKIDRCIEAAQNGTESNITIKVNGLTDIRIIDKLYAASQVGVRIDLIVRGMCSLIPGIKGMSENITVRSIVGRYLEHSRIYRFSYGEEVPTIYVGSADLMKRNLDHRVEIVVPIKNKKIIGEIDQLLELYLKDNTNSHTMKGNEYIPPALNPGDKDSFSIQNYLIEKYKRIEKEIIR
jgi:polyphosphate kinase